MTPTEKYAQRIAKLLAKAESTTPEEAELLVAKAQALMTEYAITEALIDQARGVERDEIDRLYITFEVDTYRHEHNDLLRWIAGANGCRYIRHPAYRGAWGSAGVRDKGAVVGFKSDLRRVEQLYTSLQLQAATALSDWWRTYTDKDWQDSNRRTKARRAFLQGFAHTIRLRLEEGKRAGERAAAEAEGERSGTDVEDATQSVALVLRSRKDRVDGWVDESYGRLTTTRGRRYSSGHNGFAAGSAAGSRADIGNSLAGRKALPA